MPTLEQLEEALVRADQAGNTEDARILASEVAQMRSDPLRAASQARNIEQDLTPPPMRDTGGLRQALAETLGVGTETAGGVYGGMRGAASGAARGARFGAPGALVGGVAGGVLGAAGGTGAAGALRAPTEYALGLQPEVTPERIGRDIIRGAGAGAIGELAGRGIIGGVNALVARPLGRTITGSKYTTQEDLALAERAGHMGITLRPAEVSRSDVAAQVESTAGRSLYGKRQFQLRDVANEKALSQHIDGLVQRDFGQPLTQQEAGATIQQIVKGESIPAWKAERDALYQQIGQTITAPVKMEPLVPIIRQLKAGVDPELFPQTAKLLNKIERDISTVTTQPVAPMAAKKMTKQQAKELPFLEAVNVRSYLLELGRADGMKLPSREAGMSNKLASMFDTQMEAAARETGPDAYKTWRQANEFTRKGHELFDSATIQQLLKTNPEDVVAASFKKNAITETERVMKALEKSPDGQRLYRNAAMQKVLKDASTDGYLNGQKFYNALYGKNGVGETVINKTFPPAFVDELRKTAEVAHRMGQSSLPSVAGNPSQTGRSLINWFEQSMLINIPADFLRYAVQGRFGEALKSVAMNTAQTGTYILTQKQLALILNSPEGLRILRQGLHLTPKQEGATRAVTQLLSIATKDAMATPTETTAGVAMVLPQPRPTDLPRRPEPAIEARP